MHMNCLFTTCIKYKTAHHIKSSLVSYAEIISGKCQQEISLKLVYRAPGIQGSYSRIRR